MQGINCYKFRMLTSGLLVSMSLTLLIMSVTPCKGEGWLGWILGRTSSPFYDPPIPEPSEKEPVVLPVDVAVAKIPFEVSTADDKFLLDAQKYTSMQLSELDTCQHKVILQVQGTCAELSEEDISKLGVNLLNCQSAIEGRRTYPCTTAMSLRECTAKMDPETWNAYHIVSNRARSVCYAARQQQFRAMTEMAVNKLMQNADDQLRTMKLLKEGQEELNTLSAKTFTSVAKGQQELLAQQGALQSAQQQSYNHIAINIRDLAKEKALIAAGNKELTELVTSVRSRLAETAQMLAVQGSERQTAHVELLKDLSMLESKITNVWHQMDDAMRQMTITQQDSLEMLTQTFNSLSKVNETVNFLLVLSNKARDQLDWFGTVLTSNDEKIKQGWVWAIHTAYLLCGMVALSFLQSPAFTRAVFLIILPLNLITQLRTNEALDWTGIVVVLTTLTLIRNLVLRLTALCSARRPKHEIAKPHIPLLEHQPTYSSNNTETGQRNDESDESLVSQSSIEIVRVTGSTPRRDSLPMPGTPDSAKRNLFPDELPATPSVYLRPRRTSTSSFQGTTFQGPLSLTPTNSRSGTPRRGPSGTPRPMCQGVCQSGKYCQKPASASSTYCYIHQTSIHE